MRDDLPADIVTLSSIACTKNTFVCTYSRRLAIKTYKTYIMASNVSSSVSCVDLNPVDSANSDDANTVFLSQLSQDSQDSPSQSCLRNQFPDGAKRKASPLFKTAVKRPTPTRRSKNTQSIGESIGESLLGAMSDPAFISAFTPLIQSILAPTIQSSIDIAANKAVEKFQSEVINQIIESNSKLQVIAEKQLNTISDLKSKLEDQTCRLAENNKVVDDLVNKVKTLSSELDSLKSSTNSIEQYGRRNSLRFTNMKLDVKTGE